MSDQKFDAKGASASAKNKMVEISFDVGGGATVVVRLDPDTAKALSQQLASVVITANRQ